MTFDKALKHALKLWKTPTQLAQQSLLATPSFLAGAMPNHPATDWGELLQAELLATAETLIDERPITRDELESRRRTILQHPGSGAYHYLLLELRYFNRFYRPRSLRAIYAQFTQQSRAEFYRDLDKAVTALGQRLLLRLRPVAVDSTPPPPSSLVGRDVFISEALTALAQQSSVGLLGPPGSGKSAVAAHIAAKQTRLLFWFRGAAAGWPPFLAALAQFLHDHGATSLWRALAAAGGHLTDRHLALALARQDLARLSERPLFCFDDVDNWYDAALAVWLPQLAADVDLLLTGVRLPVDVDRRYLLAGLQQQDALRLLSGSRISSAAQRRIVAQTGGNPRLLRLAHAALRSGVPADILLADERPTSILASYVAQIEARLPAAARRLLQSLAVQRVAAPADAFDSAAVLLLTDSGLLEASSLGAIELQPAVRAAVAARMSAEQRQQEQQQAAALYAARGEVTLAAYHLLHAGQTQSAIHIWYPQRATALRRGHAQLAVEIFNAIDDQTLPPRERRLLHLIRAELYKLIGMAGEGAAELSRLVQPADGELRVLTTQLRGSFEAALGYPDRALASYAESREVATRLLGQLVDIYDKQARLHLRERSIAPAQQAAQRAKYTAEQLYGLVYEQQGELTLAQRHYEQALSLAEQADDVNGLIEAHRCLLTVKSRRGAIEQAAQHAAQAIDLCDSSGNLLAANRIRSNLAAAYLDARRFEQVLTVGRPALDFFRRVANPHAVAGTACNLAEASFELGDLAAARRLAQLALQQEEPLATPYALYTLGLVAQAEGQREAAERLFSQCRQIAQRNQDRFIEAYALWRLSQTGSQPQQALEARDSARRYFEQMGLQQMVQQLNREET